MLVEARKKLATHPALGAIRWRSAPWEWVRQLLWWLVPVAALAAMLLPMHAALQERPTTPANAPMPPLLPGDSAGQTFVARYPNLSGVKLRIGTFGRGRDPDKASLVLHVRAAPGPGPDLATARLTESQPLEENSWHLFSFPPIPDSQNKNFYIEIESPDATPQNALTLFWWQQNNRGNPYAQGTAYRSGQPQLGDLAFGLQYSPSAWDAWVQMMRAASSNFPLGAMSAMLLALVLGFRRIARRVTLSHSNIPAHKQVARVLFRYSLIIALSTALFNGLLYIFIVPPWQGPDEYAHYAYAALLDKYELDNGIVQVLESAGRLPDVELSAAINTSLDKHDFTRRVIGHSEPGATNDIGPTLFLQTRQPAPYYWLCALATRSLRAVGIPSDPYTNPDVALHVMRGVSLLLNLALVALAWIAGALLMRRRPWLRFLLPITVALLPMHAFNASTVNNDILAEVVVTALFVVLIALLRWPTGQAAVASLMLAVTLTIASADTKQTGLAAAISLLALGLAIWLGIMVTRLLRHYARRPWLREWWVLPVGASSLCLFVGLALALLAFTPGGAAGWHRQYWPTVERVARKAVPDAHHGSFVIELAPSSSEGGVAKQTLYPPLYHPAMAITVTGWVRLAEPLQGDAARAKAALLVREGRLVDGPSRVAGSGEATVLSTTEWTPISATARISENAEAVSLELVAGGAKADEGVQAAQAAQAVQFDDLSLQVGGPAAGWRDPVFPLGLLNPSAERGSRSLSGLFASTLPGELQQMVDVAVNAQPFDKSQLWGHYADMQYRSFWGNFGWLSMPLPGEIFALIGAIIILSSTGLAGLALTRAGHWSYREWLGFISVAALLFTVLAGFARQQMMLAVYGLAAYPQGRYLFVLIVPIIWLLLTGAWAVWSAVWRGAREIRLPDQTRVALMPLIQGGSRHSRRSWALWLYANALVAFAAYSLFALIAPYYYG